MSPRSPFRKWIIACAAWITCVGLVGYVAVFRDVPRQFRYVYQVRTDVESWQAGRSPELAPIYEVMRSPAQDRLFPRFVPLDDPDAIASNEWHKHVEEGPMLQLFFFDGTVLHLASLLNETDRGYLMDAFWDERWSRWSLWAARGMPWIAVTFLPPLLLLGALWLARRSRSSRRAD